MNPAPKHSNPRQPDQKIVEKVRRSDNQVTPLDTLPGEADQEFMTSFQHRRPSHSHDEAYRAFGRPS